MRVTPVKFKCWIGTHPTTPLCHGKQSQMNFPSPEPGNLSPYPYPPTCPRYALFCPSLPMSPQGICLLVSAVTILYFFYPRAKLEPDAHTHLTEVVRDQEKDEPMAVPLSCPWERPMEVSGAPNTFPRSQESGLRGTTLGTMLRWVATLMPLLFRHQNLAAKGVSCRSHKVLLEK